MTAVPGKLKKEMNGRYLLRRNHFGKRVTSLECRGVNKLIRIPRPLPGDAPIQQKQHPQKPHRQNYRMKIEHINPNRH